MPIGQKTIQTIDDQVQSTLIEELRQQGHTLTGSLEQSIQSLLGTDGSGITLDVYANDYLGGREGDASGPLNTGVAAERIPFGGNATGAKTSQYIEGLKNYAKRRFGISDEKVALSAAFAIAKTHKKEGMPSQGSYAHSQNGQRTESLERTLNDNENAYDQILENGIDQELDDYLDIKSDVLTI